MKKTNCLFTLWVAVLCADSAYAVGTAPAIFSQYGEIQSVKKYSSNPFWNKDSPYNQNFPKPIYATGADLNTGDCNRVVENLVTSYCAEHNYCTNLRISDVRPTIMVQLSQLPGHNFATSCGGYIDSAFENFQKTYGNTSAVNLPKTGTQTTNIEIANPFAPKQTAQQKAVAERTAELERLQSITTPTSTVRAENFPATTADLSFTDRIANTAAGYEQYKDLESYKKPNFLGEDEAFFERLKAQNFEKYCERQPNSEECKKLREHNITYNTFGSNTNCKPTKYETGKGATVSCIPVRQNSTFLGWCTDFETATTYDSEKCPMQHVINKTETKDFIFYAKWECYTDQEYIQTQNECRDPAAPVVDPGGGGGSGCATPCPDADHMTQNPITCDCTCTGLYQPTTTDPNKCECSIDTSNLDSTEQSRVATSCECPSTKPNYNPTTHLCEEDSTPPPSDKKYTILQCRPKSGSVADLSKIFTKGFDPHSTATLDCANSMRNDRLLKKCFTPCKASSPDAGYINQLLESKIPEFCTGYKNDAGSSVYFFSSKQVADSLDGPWVKTVNTIEFTKKQIDDIKNTLMSQSESIPGECHDPNRPWWIYIFEITTDNNYKLIDRIKLSD